MAILPCLASVCQDLYYGSSERALWSIFAEGGLHSYSHLVMIIASQGHVSRACPCCHPHLKARTLSACRLKGQMLAT